MSSPGASPGVSWRRPNRWGYRSSMRTVCSNSSRRHDPHRGPGPSVDPQQAVGLARALDLDQRRTELLGDIAGDHADRPFFASGGPGAAVPEGRFTRRIDRGEPLGEERRDHPGEDVAGPGRRERRVSAGVDVDQRPVVDQRHVALQERRDPVLRDEGAEALDALLFLERAFPVQPGELAGVWREDGAFAAQQTQILAEMMERARVRDDREIRRAHDAADDLAHLGGEREAGADPDRAATARRLEDLLDRLRRLVFVVRDDDLLDEMSA